MSSPQAMHAAVLAGYVEPRPTADGRVLWRLDPYDDGRKLVLYVLSPDKPDFTHLVEQAGWPTTHAWDTRPYEALLTSLRVGQRWQFRLTANPVHSVRRDGWNDTKPLAHVTVTQQQQWLLDRMAGLGFAVVPVGNGPEPQDRDVTVIARAVHRFHRGDSRVTVATATFEGHLEVVDVDAMRHTLTHGTGRAKAYGCGLLTLARPRTRLP